MAFRVAINGYGRIGQALLRAIHLAEAYRDLKVVAINEMATPETLSYATRYDSTCGRFPLSVAVEGDGLIVAGERIAVLNQPVAGQADWAAHEVDLVFECSGSFTDRAGVDRHLEHGAKRLLFSQPAWEAADATIIYGFNTADLRAGHRVVSAASCTTNCVVHILRFLDEVFGLRSGVSTTIHAAMNDQPVIDRCQGGAPRLSRGALNAIVPIETGLGQGIGKFFPHLVGRFESHHLRVPTTNVSLMDLSLQVRREADVDQVNNILREAAEGALRGILGYSADSCVSADFNLDPCSGIVDATQTRVCAGKLVKVFAWFDNEFSYARRMLDLAQVWLSLQSR